MTSKRTPKNTQEFVDYRIGELESKVDTVQGSVDRVNDKLNNTFATKDFVVGVEKNLSDRIGLLEDDRKWLIRLIIGTVLLGIIGAYIGFK